MPASDRGWAKAVAVTHSVASQGLGPGPAGDALPAASSARFPEREPAERLTTSAGSPGQEGARDTRCARGQHVPEVDGVHAAVSALVLCPAAGPRLPARGSAAVSPWLEPCPGPRSSTEQHPVSWATPPTTPD